MEREWIGIDLTYLATGAVKVQIEKFFPQLRNMLTITGTPENEEQALKLASDNPLAFEEWVITHVLKFRANEKKTGDGGIDGTFKYPLGRIKGKQKYGKAVAQVKGGTYELSQIRDFRTAMRNEKAELGVFVVTTRPTQQMLTEAAREGTFSHPSYELTIPKLQIYVLQDYFKGSLARLPYGESDIIDERHKIP